jgi:hypothetical protein
LRDDLGWAGLPETDDPALAEWLEGASCSPRVKALAGAEECMRGAGLRPGHDRMAGPDRADG